MSLTFRQFTRTSPPDPAALQAALAPFFTSAGAFLWEYSPQTQKIVIEYADWTGINLTNVQTAITNCIAETDHTDAKSVVDNMPLWEKAFFLVLLDEINLIRSLLVPAQNPRTVNQLFNAVRNKIDTL